MQLLKRFHDNLEAGVAQGVLEDGGIESLVSDEALAVIDPRLAFANGGIRLMVADEDMEGASKILREFYAEQGDPQDELDEINVPLEIAKFGSKFLGLALLGVSIATGIIIVLINIFRDKP